MPANNSMVINLPRDVIVASYNMSFASDLGCHKDALFLLPNSETMVPDVVADMGAVSKNGKKTYPPSEALFLSRASTSREFWINAQANLKKFILEVEPAFVGLQEMNVTAKGSNTGTDAIENMVLEINSTGKNYVQVAQDMVCNIFGNMTRIGLSIILDKNLCGNPAEIKIVDNPLQAGRPLLYVTTDKGFLLVSMHGAQKPANGMNRVQFNEDMKSMNQKFIEDTINTNLGGQKFKQIFVAADLNDRYDSLKYFKLCGTTVKQDGAAPRACCYNWDSSCPDNSPYLKDLLDGYSTCDIPVDMKNKLPSFVPNLDAAGSISNYRYTGDKVFGKNPTSKIEIYKSDFIDEYGASTASDHELVYASFSLGAAVSEAFEISGLTNVISNLFEGGRRQTRRNQRQRQSKSKSKSKRQNQRQSQQQRQSRRQQQRQSRR